MQNMLQHASGALGFALVLAKARVQLFSVEAVSG
jgi:hypothetical protein